MFNKNQLDEYITTTKKLMAENPLMNEPNTKVKVIAPFLKLLGWDINFDVTLEYPVKIGSKTAKVDYALLIENEPIVFVEAKGFDSTIGDNEARQAISYGRVEGVKWATVTNGKEIHIFNTSWGKNPKDCLIAKIKVENFSNKQKTLWLLSKESILSQEIDDVADNIRKNREFIEKLNNNKETISERIADVIKEYSSKTLYKRIDKLSNEVIVDFINRLDTSPKEIEIVDKPNSSIRTQETKDISRNNISGEIDEEVVVFPAREDGVEFLLKYEAWGFVKLNRNPKYFALYVAHPYSKVLYFGEIEKITKPYQNKDEIKKIEEDDKTTFTPGKQVIYLKEGTLVKLSKPVPKGGKGSVPQGLRYTTLKKLKNANTTEDLW